MQKVKIFRSSLLTTVSTILFVLLVDVILYAITYLLHSQMITQNVYLLFENLNKLDYLNTAFEHFLMPLIAI